MEVISGAEESGVIFALLDVEGASFARDAIPAKHYEAAVLELAPAIPGVGGTFLRITNLVMAARVGVGTISALGLP